MPSRRKIYNRPISVVKPKKARKAQRYLLPDTQPEHQERSSNYSDFHASDVETNGKRLPRLRDTVETVKKRFAENDRRRVAEQEKQWVDDLRKQILLIWNKDHSQPVPKIVKQLRIPSGYSKKNQNLNQLVNEFISTTEIRGDVQKSIRVEKELERLKQENQQKRTPEENKRLDALQRRNKERKKRRLDTQTQNVKNKEHKQHFVQQIKETARVRTQKRTQVIGQQEERARRYVEIKSKVASSFQLLKEQPQSQISLQSIGLTANELAFGAVAPASTDQERKEALFLAKAAGDGTAVSAVLLENFPKNPPTSKRRSNIVDALRALGKSDEVAKLLSEHGVIENTKTLEWSVLPPGWWNDSKYTDQITKNAKTGQLLIERLRYVDQLNPLERWRSQEQLGSAPYWVFVFPHHVVAECPTHGNAIYIIKGTSDWRNLLNRSKEDLLAGFPGRVVRIIHSGDWQSRLRRKLREK